MLIRALGSLMASAIVFTAACGGSGTPSGPPCSVENVRGTVPGVTISIFADKCVFAPGEKAQFRYEVTTTADVPALATVASQSCGSCRRASGNPESWIHWIIDGRGPSGQSIHYCLCDTGCCPPDEAASFHVDAKTSRGVIDWSGHAWDGPSDTNQPQGDSFPPGDYNVEVTFDAPPTGAVTASLPIRVVD